MRNSLRSPRCEKIASPAFPRRADPEALPLSDRAALQEATPRNTCTSMFPLGVHVKGCIGLLLPSRCVDLDAFPPCVNGRHAWDRQCPIQAWAEACWSAGCSSATQIGCLPCGVYVGEARSGPVGGAESSVKVWPLSLLAQVSLSVGAHGRGLHQDAFGGANVLGRWASEAHVALMTPNAQPGMIM